MQKIENIEIIKKRFHRQWLLIAVKEVNDLTTTPITGRLLAHSPHRDEVYRKVFSLPKRQNVLVEYSDDKFPRGFAAAL